MDGKISAPKHKGMMVPPAKPKPVRIGLNEDDISNCATPEDLLKLLRKDSDVVDLPAVGERAKVAPPDFHHFVMPPKSPPPIQVRLNHDEIAKATTVEEFQELVCEGVIDVRPPKQSLIEAPTSPKAVKTLLDRDRVKHCSSIKELRELMNDATVEVKPPKSASKVHTHPHTRLKRHESDGGTPFPEGPKPRVQKDTIEDCATIEDLKKIVLQSKDEVDTYSSEGVSSKLAGGSNKAFGRTKIPGVEVKARSEKQRSFVRSKVPGAALTISKRAGGNTNKVFGRSKIQGTAAKEKISRGGQEAFGRTKGASPAV